ncbi:MAG: hypothetical protein ACI376_09210 [Candidatus Bruticola sp.]
MYPQKIYITANSPGEIAGWLSPVAAAVHRRWPGCSISVILLPCPFATGSEGKVALELLHINEVIRPHQYFQLLWEGSSAKHKNSVLLHLGGDLMYSAALAWRWKIPAWSYLWGRWWWDSAFKGYFIKDEKHYDWMRRHKLPLEKAITIGDLVVDDVRFIMQSYLARYGSLPQSDPNLISFLPGSRVTELTNLSPFFLRTAQLMKQIRPSLRFQMQISPFIPPNKLVRALQAPPHPAVGGIQGKIIGDTLQAEGVAIEIVRRHQLPKLSASALCITIPGTKTAEAAVLGVPELMVLPINRPDQLPYIGLIGLLDWIPGGRQLKGRLLMRMRHKVGFMAQPNILANRLIVPEIIDVVTPAYVASAALGLLDDPQQIMQQKCEFSRMYSPYAGASDRLLEAIERTWHD